MTAAAATAATAATAAAAVTVTLTRLIVPTHLLVVWF